MTINAGLLSSRTDNWATPPEVFSALNEEFGPFTVDVCASPSNAKCARFYTKSQDGLTKVWRGRVWMNPPYGRSIGAWMSKAYSSVEQGTAEVVCCLVPARTDTAWWHDFAAKGYVRFIRGRLRFGNAKNSAPFPSAIVVFRRHRPTRRRAAIDAAREGGEEG